jgi:hypothetical protein
MSVKTTSDVLEGHAREGLTPHPGNSGEDNGNRLRRKRAPTGSDA